MSRPRLVIDIEPIYGHSVIGDREVLERFVELPLLAACQHLYDLNVRTIQSSANRNDILVDAPAWIVLDLEGLSTANLAYAEPQAVEISPFMDGDVLRRPARFIFPMTPISTVAEVEAASTEFARGFQLQTMDWSPRYTMGEARQKFGLQGKPDEEVIAYMEGTRDSYWAPVHGRFFMSEEHFRKIKAAEDSVQTAFERSGGDVLPASGTAK